MTAVLHILAGPNGAGKTTLAERLLQPTLYLPFINADRIAAERWPEDTEAHAYKAARVADSQRRDLMNSRRSFITETVFSHPSKTDLVRQASRLGYQIHLHVILVPLELTLARVDERVTAGGHSVPREKIMDRYHRLWQHVEDARAIADITQVYDNTTARSPFRIVAEYDRGRLLYAREWPAWAMLHR